MTGPEMQAAERLLRDMFGGVAQTRGMIRTCVIAALGRRVTDEEIRAFLAHVSAPTTTRHPTRAEMRS